MRRGVTIAVVLVIVALGVPTGAASGGPAAPIPGLSAGASIERDQYGVAHVRAANRRDLSLLQGWIHAEDRLFQMDVSRRLASGTLAELMGPEVLKNDVTFRTVGLRRAAVRSLPLLSHRTRQALQAYADGVNAYALTHALPPEYAALHLTRFEPWWPLDTLVIDTLYAFAFSTGASQDVALTQTLVAYRQGGQQGGFDGTKLFFDDLVRAEPFDHAATLPDAGVGSALTQEVDRTAAIDLDAARADALKRLLGDDGARLAMLPVLEDLGGQHVRAGSNEWVISGRLSASGVPLLANDPHLSLTQPSVLYPIHLRSGNLDVVGESFPGAPGVALGHNRSIAWGATVNPADTSDVYLEQVRPYPLSPSGLATVYKGTLEPIVAIPERYFQNNRTGKPDDVTPVPPSGTVPPATLIVPRRNQGPIINLDPTTGAALSLQWGGFSGIRNVEAFLGFDEATSVQDFRRALEHFDGGSLNFSYADVHGNIAYFASGELPLREDLEAGTVHGLPPFLVRDGTGGNEWLPARNRYPGQMTPYEILPPQEMPQTVNPPAGFFVSANNDPTGDTLDNDPLNQRRPTGGIRYLGADYLPGNRAGRITQLIRRELAGDGTVSMADMGRIQADVALRDAEVFVPYIVRALANGQQSADPTLRALAEDSPVAAAVNRLGAWDFTTPTGIPEGYDAADVNGERSQPDAREIASSVAATIYAVWRGEIVRQVIDSRLDPLRLPVPDYRALAALRHLLEHFAERGGVGASGIDFFAVAGVPAASDRRDVLLLRSVKVALDRLAGPDFAAAFHGSSNQDDYRWGRLHRVTLTHPLDGPLSIPPGAGAFPPPLPDLAGIPTDGGYETVDASPHDIRADSAKTEDFLFEGGPAKRLLAEMTPGRIRAESSWPGGTSAIPGSPRYVNLLPHWLTNDTVSLPRR